MRKIVCCLVFILIICIFSTIVYADASDIFGITNGSGAKGEEVTLYISLEKELEFASAGFLIEYDTSKLEYVGYEELEIFKKSAMNIVNNNSDNGKIAIGYVSNPETATTKKSPGQMLSITFKVKTDDADSVKLDLKCTSLKTDAGDDIEAADAQSVISVIKKSNTDTDSDDDKDKDNNSGSDTSDRSSTDRKTNIINYTTPNDQANGILPYTGIKSIIALIITFIIISIYFYKKYKLFKNI